MRKYVESSVNLHLFFLRIMKEHAIFLESSFQKPDVSFQKNADNFKVQFERLLEECVRFGKHFASRNVIESGEIVTPYTMTAERQTQSLTGISINSNITGMEQQLRCGEQNWDSCSQMEYRRMKQINQRALRTLDQFIHFKERILQEVKRCRMFTSNYPLLIDHILREAKLYQKFLCELEETGKICPVKEKEKEEFWNQIMMEHALFIRGLLDPTENELIAAADGFVGEYAELLREAKNKQDCIMRSETAKSQEVTLRFRDFKAAGAKGISECKISSVILPLLADHVLREANHYLREVESETASCLHVSR